METRKQANYAMKTESVRNRTVCNDLNTNHTSANKLVDVRNFSINLLQKESAPKHYSVKNSS